MRRLFAIIAVLSIIACENPNQVRERKYHEMCPPGYACLSPAFAVNHLKHDIWVTYDVKRRRFVQAKASDKDAIQLHEGGIVDFWRVPQYVVETPGPSNGRTVNVRPNQSSDPLS